MEYGNSIGSILNSSQNNVLPLLTMENPIMDYPSPQLGKAHPCSVMWWRISSVQIYGSS